MPRILVVDDEVGILEIVRVNLETEGFEVESAEDGEGALRLAREFHPDLVLLDVMLPDVDGWQVLAELEATPSLAGIPVVMLTARAADEDILHGLEEGAVEYITKPFYPEDLVASVKIILNVFDPSLREDYRRQLIAKRRRMLAGHS